MEVGAVVTSDGNQPAGGGGGARGGAVGGLKRGRLRSRRARLVLALTAGVVGLLCLGGAGIFFVLYDDATKIERTSPESAVNDFLGAFAASRNDSDAALYQCKSGGDFASLTDFRSDTEQREKEFAVGISITWSITKVATVEKNSVVTADLTRTIKTQGGRDGSTWQFAVVDEDGWRVCGATKIT